MNSGGNTVNLGNCADTHKTCKNSENRKQFCKPLPFCAHTLFDIVKRSAEEMSVAFLFSEFNCEEALGILCCHSEKRRNKHPQKRTRTAETNCGCNADDISRSDCSGKRRTKCAERGYLALACVLVFYHIFECLTEMENLNKACSDSKPCSCTKNKNNKRPAPYQDVDLFN